MVLAQLKSALYRMNIVFEERHFETLMAKIDADGSGTISYKEFMKYFAKGSADDRNLSKKVTGVSVAQAKKMIRFYNAASTACRCYSTRPSCNLTS